MSRRKAIAVTVFLNNCNGRPFTRWYGPDAFYDLRLDGKQARMATGLKSGQECLVATRADSDSANSDSIEFTWFSFSHEKVMEIPNQPGVAFRVFFGARVRSENLSKAIAAATEPYSKFFNIKGEFKQRSVIIN
jgi:hypothetical protein